MTSICLFIGPLMRFLAVEYFVPSLIVFMFIMVICAYFIHVSRNDSKIFVALAVLIIMLALLFSLVVVKEETNGSIGSDRMSYGSRTAAKSIIISVINH